MKFRYNKKTYIFNKDSRLYVDNEEYRYICLGNPLGGLVQESRNELLSKPYLSLLKVSALNSIPSYVFHDKSLSNYNFTLFKYEVLSTIELNKVRILKVYRDIHSILDEK